MTPLTGGIVRRWLDTLLHIEDTPERTAAAFALGVFFGFSPFLGLHTVLGIIFAFLLNVNRVAVLLGIYSNLPWIIGAYYFLRAGLSLGDIGGATRSAPDASATAEPPAGASADDTESEPVSPRA